MFVSILEGSPDPIFERHQAAVRRWHFDKVCSLEYWKPQWRHPKIVINIILLEPWKHKRCHIGVLLFIIISIHQEGEALSCQKKLSFFELFQLLIFGKKVLISDRFLMVNSWQTVWIVSQLCYDVGIHIPSMIK